MPFSDNRDRFISLLRNGKGFFFAGSGISFLSFMPSAGKILNKTANIFLPDDGDTKNLRDRVIISEEEYYVQPELFYENLLYIHKTTDSLALWKSLSPNYLKMFGYTARPNINHLYIVNYSVKNKVPIFTTNFDCLFEEAATELGYEYEVLLPYTQAETTTIELFRDGSAKSDVAYIFKLHGSIKYHNHIETLENLHTTMVSITKINYPVIDLLEKLCIKKNIVFLGYSGRDIDYFPEIKKLTLVNKPYWIDKFQNIVTRSNCEYISAYPVICFPNEIFEQERPDLYRHISPIEPLVEEDIFSSLQDELKNKLMIADDERVLLLGLLVKETGNYRLAYKFLLGLYRNNSLSKEKKAILLLCLANLAHENSLYESCGYFSKETLRLVKKKVNLKNFYIRALLQISESKRMLVAYDADFINYVNYPAAVFALISFLFNTLLVKERVRRIRKINDKDIADILTIHDFIEHRIRVLAMVQGLFKPILESDKKETVFAKLIHSWLLNNWQLLRQESFLEGHSHGVASTIRFITRIIWDVDELHDGTHIFDMRNYETGKGLALRNFAENSFKHGKYLEAKKYYQEFCNTGLKSGNKLNAIKGFIGIATCNRALLVSPLLEQNEIVVLKDLMRSVEGKDWENYFSRVLEQLDI